MGTKEKINKVKKELEEYRLAVEDNLNASKAETDAKLWKKKAHYRLLRASEELRQKTRELLEDSYVLNI